MVDVGLCGSAVLMVVGYQSCGCNDVVLRGGGRVWSATAPGGRMGLQIESRPQPLGFVIRSSRQHHQRRWRAVGSLAPSALWIGCFDSTIMNRLNDLQRFFTSPPTPLVVAPRKCSLGGGVGLSGRLFPGCSRGLRLASALFQRRPRSGACFMSAAVIGPL